MMTVKSPLTTLSSFRLYYPTTWTIKEYINTPKSNDTGSYSLVLTKNKNTLTLSSSLSYTCDKPSFFHNIAKDKTIWEIQEVAPASSYQVCETGNGAEPVHIGSITFTGTDIDGGTIDEFVYIIEKIAIIK